MKLPGIRVVWSRSWVAVAMAVMLSVFAADTAPAQQATSDAAQKKIEQLTKLLEDPDVRALLAAHAKSQPDEQMPNMSASDLTSRLDEVQDHIRAVREAIPLVPSEFLRAVETTKAGVDGRRPVAVLLLFLLLVGIGL